ncbi:signal peptide peptidase SppA [Anaerococcus hydrogenalis]|uniref:Signal peptide peptidase SppA, 36K type n=2 Tax=Anaerococcus hydrogenalis TaxID=33029 RepID=F0GYS8_9FIRM|nr:signal peptide peptidase SppA [Anaerococcus hydrogenalis]EGC84596.1 signal peptide peptidase SppA, 36K type [Anaerococcus hydrogenalis ACS-025-V-Sch4]MDK7695525.1 signal peptide peptidase SppA [Anaerococcus hydrogenalis]MDK7697245.1 signal peptide peptidase SppA [Anaerococcus hydrogenalis]MDK7708552.1 signal peptide peptidase SppA [Anaerococcus hydrogenalis]PMC81014.1 signal peptide peptidase SppA [Anaerococcus hydrogenalis]
MKKNKSKRWIAVAIALLLFVASTIVSNRGEKQAEKKSEELKNQYFDQFNPFSATANKKTLEKGDSKNKIAVLSYEGAIGDGQVYDDFMDQLDDVYDDDSVKGVIMQVNSPGGAVYNSEQIANKIKKIQKDKKIPVFTVMKTMAASGGYYISAPTDRIYASNETLTGSIGVIMSSTSFQGLFEKYGIKQQNITTGKMKDAGSAGKDMTDEQKKYFQDLINSSFDRFVKIVSQGRSMKEDEVRKLADGRVYDGAQAKSNGLVDKIGDLDLAIEDMKKDFKLNNAEVYQYDNDMASFSRFFSKAENLLNKNSSSDLSIIKELMEKDSPLPMYYYGK